MAKKAHLLLVEDDELLGRAYMAFLQDLPCEVSHVTNGAAAIEAIRQQPPDLLLLDLLLPDMHGLTVLDQLRSRNPAAKTIVVTTEASSDSAISALQQGASDYLVKPLDGERLRTTVHNAVDRWQLEQRLHDYESALSGEHFEGFVGQSPQMRLLYRIIDSASASDASVCISGESGTGKELCAHAIHQRSRRSSGPLVVFNCAAIPSELMESELFGHERGAFTGASSAHTGAAARADGGTLFFDEIGEMSLDLQAKLLRFLQTRRFLPVGSAREQETDTRFISTTNRDLLAEVHAGRFRDDLYYRLFVVPIELPPLRERGDDVLLLAEHALMRLAKAEHKSFSGFSARARRCLRDYHWPGNVRQLENLIQQLVVFSPGGEIDFDRLPDSMAMSDHGWVPGSDEVATEDHRANSDIRPLWQEERDVIERAIALCDDNVVEAAKQLQISDSTIYRKRRRWAVKPSGD